LAGFKEDSAPFISITNTAVTLDWGGGRKMYRVLLDNMKLDLEGINREGVDWFLLPQDWGQWQAVVSMAMNVWWYKVQVMSLLA